MMYLFSFSMRTRGYSRHFQFIKNVAFPLPPLEEQKRIVAKLEEVLPLCAWGEGATSEPPAGQGDPPVAEGE